MSVSTISREIHQNSFNKNVMIKKNIFGHKWILKINEQEGSLKKKKHRKLIVFAYILAFLSILLAACFGIIFSLDHNIFRVENKNTPKKSINSTSHGVETKSDIFVTDALNITTNTLHPRVSVVQNSTLISIENTTSDAIKISEVLINTTNPYCQNCTKYQVCIKTKETEKPKCIKMHDRRDPTGCGGLCKINTEYCKNLDRSFQVYQCLKLRNVLNCPEKTFNCGNMCVSIVKRCNGQIDCSNMMDEKNCECNLETHFHCGNQTSCLAKNKLCNGKVDCWDKSDEIICRKDDIFCEENHVPCSNGQCIPKEKMCDKVFDCSDRTDEPFWCQEIRHT